MGTSLENIPSRFVDITAGNAAEHSVSAWYECNGKRINARSDMVTYSLNIKCDENSAASSFDYYIPIPRIDSGRDSYLVGGYDEEAYSFELLGAVQISGDAIYLFEYTTEPDFVYKDIRGLYCKT